MLSRLTLRTFCLADQLGSFQCQNELIDEYIAIGDKAKKRVPSASSVRWVYENLPERSMLQKVMIDYYLGDVKIAWLENNATTLPKRFLAELVVGFGKAVDNNTAPEPPSSKARCYYHVHNEEVPACVTRVKD